MPQKTLGHWIEYDCRACGKHCKRWVRPSYEHKPWKYCDRQCAGLGRVRQPIPCAYCGKPFHPLKQARYCSRECFALSTRGRIASNAHPDEVIAAIRKLFPTRGPAPIAKRFGLTTRIVQNLAYKQGIVLNPDIRKERKGTLGRTLKGPRNPNWHGGIVVNEWGANWQEQRRATIRRDLHLCQVCFQPARSVHHIKPRRLFLGHMEDANILSNLITLCRRHHNLVECGKVPCPTPRT